jgi:hypothetical protein
MCCAVRASSCAPSTLDYSGHLSKARREFAEKDGSRTGGGGLFGRWGEQAGLALAPSVAKWQLTRSKALDSLFDLLQLSLRNGNKGSSQEVCRASNPCGRRTGRSRCEWQGRPGGLHSGCSEQDRRRNAEADLGSNKPSKGCREQVGWIACLSAPADTRAGDGKLADQASTYHGKRQKVLVAGDGCFTTTSSEAGGRAGTESRTPFALLNLTLRFRNRCTLLSLELQLWQEHQL